MRFSHLRSVSLIASLWLAGGELFSQTLVTPAVGAAKIEPGLELAVNWKWWVAAPENQAWGMPLPEALVAKKPGSPAAEAAALPAPRPETYEVKKGDAIIKIARKFAMTAAQLKQFNEMKDDRIRVGQVLRIPTAEQLLTLVPPPPQAKPEVPGKKKSDKPAVAPEADSADPGGEAKRELDTVLLQVFLDREGFSPGAINGQSGTTFLKIRQIYQNCHADAADPGLLRTKAEAALKQPYTSYILRADDFKFIKSAKTESPGARSGGAPSSVKKKSSKAGDPAPPPPPLTIDQLLAAEFLGYVSAWEFVAERFHCDEVFLHRINPALKAPPGVGSEFQVPNVIPFEIETALEPPLQPASDSRKPISAAVVELSRLEISCDGKLIAVMPLASARPGLHGRGSWTVRDAIPGPRLATKREPREPPKEKPAATGDALADATPAPLPALAREQFLAPGPNNPVGILWLNLAKPGGTDPLPYGLHGTSIPARMSSQQGIGGFRLANWDIARAVHLMPVGTALQWKAR